MDFDIITSDMGLSALAEEWKQLHARAARFPFADPKSFISWWQIRGRPSGSRLHIVVGYRNGHLASLAPLVTTRRWGFRVLEWGGSELYDYCDTLADDEAAAQELWNVVRHSSFCDFAVLRDVHQHAACRSVLKTFAQETRSSRTLQIRLEFPSSDVWMRRFLSNSTQSYYRRAERRLLRLGPLRFEVCRGKPAPEHILKIMLRQKSGWLQAKQMQSWINDEASDGGALLERIAEAAADAGTLHLSWLECGGSVIATHLGLEYGGTLHWYIPTYDMQWGKYAPGRLLLLKLIEWSIDHGLSGFDFMRGEEPYKSHLANAQHQLTDFAFACSPIARLTGPWLIPWYMRRQVNVAQDDFVSGDLVPENL